MAGCLPRAAAQEASGISGQWTIDRAHSEFPAEVGFGASFMPESPLSDSTGGGGGGRGGRGNRGGARSPRPVAARPDSQDDAKRIQQLTDAVRTPPVNVSVADGGSSVTITSDGNSRTFHPNGKEESIELNQVPVSTVVTRVDAGIVVLYHIADGRDLRYTYWRSNSPAELVVDAAFVERGDTESIRRVYVAGTADTPPPAAIARSPGVPTGAPASAPPVAQGPDAELKGISKLGVIVEDLSQAAAACGLTRDAIDTAVSKSLADSGFAVVHALSSDDTTYVYVNVMTTSATSGLCVSRYDVSLFTHTAAKLSFQSSPALVQVQLAHSGSLAGGTAAAHADAVMHGVKEYVDELASRIRAVNR
jgi:hypothetical protein